MRSPHKPKNPVVTTIIVTVTSGVVGILLDYFFELGIGAKAVSAIWGVLTGTWNLLTSTYEVRGWLILVLGLAAIGLVTGVARAMTARSATPPPGSVRVRTATLKEYTSDTIYDVKWGWEWARSGIANLRSFCPACDAVLVYKEEFGKGTELICEPCSGIVKGHLNDTTLLDFGHPKVVADVRGIDLDHLQESVKRAIRRGVLKRERDADLAEAN